MKLTKLWPSVERIKHETVSLRDVTILTKQENGKHGGAYKFHIRFPYIFYI